LRISEQFDPLTKIFPALKEILVGPERIDKERLRRSLDLFSDRHRSFSEAITRANKCFDLGVVFNSDGRLARISTAEFAKWIDHEILRTSERLVGIDKICSLIQSGQDISLSELPARLESIRALRPAIHSFSTGSFVLGHDGEIDRERTLDGIRESEKFDVLTRHVPELKEILADPVHLPREALKLSVDDLHEKHRIFSDTIRLVERHIGLKDVLHSSSEQSAMTATDLAAWLERQMQRLDVTLDSLERLCALLKPAQDVSLNDLHSRLPYQEALRQNWLGINVIGSNLGLSSRDDEVWDRDWGELRAVAEWTIGFLAKHKDRPPDSLVRAATNAETRPDVVGSISRNLALRTDEFVRSWEFLTKLFDPEEEVSTGIRVGQVPVPTLVDWAEERRRDVHLIEDWVRFCELREQFVQADLGFFLSELLDGSLAVDDAKQAYLVRFFRSWLDWLYERDPILRRFGTEAHERQIERFRNLDRDAVRRSFARIREARLRDPGRPGADSFDAPSSSELGTLLREVNKKKRHLPLRELFARIPSIILRLKPCLMMSPLAVSTYLNNKEIRFDLVIFDEASQVRPYDAISSIYRGRQLVVAGDQQQLPPTSFFERTASDEELTSDEADEEERLSDFESILDVCCTIGIPRRRLRWHYRSRREPLIAFSNQNFYDNELVTFPSVLDNPENPAVRFEYLPNGLWKSSSSGGFNAVEALKTAEFVMEHFRSNPNKTLGVIAFSQRQQLAILDELERLRRMDSSLEDAFSDDNEEPFFVKNLENVQGDERDVIFLSIGYGPDEDGRVAMRFGPLNRAGGERRLNVAVTRARLEMTVISSMRSHDIDLSRTSSVGAKLLRDYLNFAERGISALGSQGTEVGEDDHDSPFEKGVAESLKQRGLEVRRQIGCSGYRIDLAVMDPENPDRFVLAIECDGATYHKSATARDRDRLRQEVLVSLGWTVVRIWSTDWVKDPIAQINRVVSAFEQCRAKVAAPITRVKRISTPEQPVKPVVLAATSSSSKSVEPPSLRYERIEDVPPSVIEDLVISSLRTYGATDKSELKVSVARRLGFQRTGAKIQSHVERCVEQLVLAGIISRTDGSRLSLNPDFEVKPAQLHHRSGRRD
jgi:very-short-patch-repair endonuclease